MHKVHIFWQGHKNLRNLHLALHYIRTKVRWRFRKILWPCQNIWTLKFKYCEKATQFKKISHFFKIVKYGCQNSKTIWTSWYARVPVCNQVWNSIILLTWSGPFLKCDLPKCSKGHDPGHDGSNFCLSIIYYLSIDYNEPNI